MPRRKIGAGPSWGRARKHVEIEQKVKRLKESGKMTESGEWAVPIPNKPESTDQAEQPEPQTDKPSL